MNAERAEKLASLEHELDALIRDARSMEQRYRPQLDEVLRSVQAYQQKKTALLPSLPLDSPDPAEVRRAVGTRQGRWTP